MARTRSASKRTTKASEKVAEAKGARLLTTNVGDDWAAERRALISLARLKRRRLALRTARALLAEKLADVSNDITAAFQWPGMQQVIARQNVRITGTRCAGGCGKPHEGKACTTHGNSAAKIHFCSGCCPKGVCPICSAKDPRMVLCAQCGKCTAGKGGKFQCMPLCHYCAYDRFVPAEDEDEEEEEEEEAAERGDDEVVVVEEAEEDSESEDENLR